MACLELSARVASAIGSISTPEAKFNEVQRSELSRTSEMNYNLALVCMHADIVRASALKAPTRMRGRT